tara:strand:+ start:1236 stop:1913 length:678 start_codon:yes stop_codon:yes gene_type:complete
MPIEIHGKKYVTVPERVNLLREQHPIDSGFGITTDLISIDDTRVLFKAEVIDAEGKTIGTGHAMEEFGSTQINQTSAVENCETSAIGRALAACGFAGTEYASANEVQNAIAQRSPPRVRHSREQSEASKQRERVAQMPVEMPPESQREEWHECELHFGKHKGVKLGQIPPPEQGKTGYLEWLQKSWQPNPEYDDPKDKHLRAMLDQSMGKVTETVEEPETEELPF